MPRALKSHTVKIDGKLYRIRGAVTQSLASGLPTKITIGDHTQDSNPTSSVWVMNDFTGGIGIETLRGERDVDRVWWGGLDLSYRGHLVLPRRADDVPKPVGAGEFVAWGELAGDLLGVFGREVYMYDGASWGPVLHTVEGDVNLVRHVDLGGDDFLVIAHSLGVDYTTDGTTWATTTLVS